MASSIRVITSYKEAREYAEAGLLWWKPCNSSMSSPSVWENVKSVNTWWTFMGEHSWRVHASNGTQYGIMVEE